MNHKRLPALPRGGAAWCAGAADASGPSAPGADGGPAGPNARWSLDFVTDQIADGRRFRILDVVDDFTRECLALVADTSISGMRVARELDGSSPGAASRR